MFRHRYTLSCFGSQTGWRFRSKRFAKKVAREFNREHSPWAPWEVVPIHPLRDRKN